MSDESKQSLAHGLIIIGALALIGAFFDQLKDLPSWAALKDPHTLGEFGSRYVGAIIAIVGAWLKTPSGDENVINKFARAVPAVLLAAVVTGAVITIPACAHPATLQTAAGVNAYQADQVVQRLTEISAVVQADTGSQPGNIRPRDAFTIIEWISGDAHANPPTTGLVQIVETAGQGQGWKAIARQSWQTRIRPIFAQYPTLAAYVTVVDALLEVM